MTEKVCADDAANGSKSRLVSSPQKTPRREVARISCLLNLFALESAPTPTCQGEATVDRATIAALGTVDVLPLSYAEPCRDLKSRNIKSCNVRLSCLWRESCTNSDGSSWIPKAAAFCVTASPFRSLPRPSIRSECLSYAGTNR